MININLQKSIRRSIAILLIIGLAFSALTFSTSQAYATDEPQAEETVQPSQEPQMTEDIASPTEQPQPTDETVPQPDETHPADDAQAPDTMQAPKRADIVTEADGTQYAGDEVIVKFKNSVSDTAAENTLDAQDSLALETIDAYDLTIAEVPEGETVRSFIDTMEAQPNVEYAEPNYVYTLDATVNDPRVSEQWYLDKIGIPAAWDMTMGLPDIKVAVLDSGIDLNHTEFNGQICSQTDTAKNDGNAQDDSYGYDPYGHGSHVAGIIAAKSNNANGISGVAPGVQLIVVDVIDGKSIYTTDIIEGIQYAVANDADVINMSLGGYNYSTSFENAVNNAANAGVVVVCSAGNDNYLIPHYPSDYSGAISVIATDENDKRASFSNYGSLKDISAPGTNILSTVPGGGYESWDGTSMASPVVAGVVALMKSLNPNLTVAQVKNILYSTAVDLMTSGFDNETANGRVNAYAAVRDVWDDLPSYTISVSKELIGPSASDYGTVTGGGTYKNRTKAVLTAVPADGYKFVRWTENGTEVSTSATYTHFVTQNSTLKAVFEKGTFTISAAANNSSYGTVSGGGSYNYGDSVTLTATPNTGYLFVRWLDDGTEVSTNQTYTFSASKSATITAEFAENTCTINAICNDSNVGNISGGGTYRFGESVTLTAPRNDYYTFMGWIEDGVTVSTDYSYTFTATKSTTIEAFFDINFFKITLASNNLSYGTVSGDGTYSGGQFAAVLASPFTGYRFVRWTENGVPVCFSPYYPITASRNMSLIAEFAPRTPITISCTKTDVSYAGGSNGTITINASGGDSGQYMYKIDDRGWYSLNVFTGLRAGTYTITVCDWSYNENTASCTVTVGEPFSSIYTPAKNISNSVSAGYKSTIIPPPPPTGFRTQSVSYTSSNPAVATVDANGNLAFVGGGKVTIIVKTIFQKADKNGKIKTKTTTIKKTISVWEPISSIALNLSNTSIARSQKIQLSAGISPATASNKKVKWTSSNPKVASVSGKGLVTGKAGGTAVITCSAIVGSASASCTVNVTPIYPTGLKMSKPALTMKLGKSAALKATITPKKTDFKTVTWTSSNPAVATVDAKGRVKAVSSGTAVITAATSNGIAVSCTVTVP